MLRTGAFSIPSAPLALTVGGLMPFVGCALAAWALQGDIARQAAVYLMLLTYGAVILSFLGGVRWGAEMADAVLNAPRWGVLSGSVAGSLFGWAGVLAYVLVAPFHWLFALMALAFILHWIWDVRSPRVLPAWYEGVRTIATAGAVLSLLIAWGSTSGLQALLAP